MARRKGEIDRAAVFEAILGDLGGDSDDVRGPLTVPLDAISFNPRQPRKHVSEAGLADLAASIRDKGVLEPVIVRAVGRGYELVAGERRTRAARLVGLAEIPAVVVDLDDRQALEVAIVENLQREDLNAVEETEAVLGLLELALDLSRSDAVALLQTLYGEERGRTASTRFTDQQRAEAKSLFGRIGRFGISSFVSNRLPILDFPKGVLDAVRDGELAFTKAQAIARVENAGDRDRLLKAAVREDLTLSQIRRRITELRRSSAEPRPGGSGSSSLVGAGGQALVSSTKRLLNRRKLATLPPETMLKVQGLLEELRKALQDG